MKRLAWIVAAGIAGAQSSFAMAPHFGWWLLFLTLPVLVLAIDHSLPENGAWYRRMRMAFWPGLAFGFGFLALSLGWVGNALLVDAERYGWLLPFAKYGLPLGLAVFYGIGASLASLIWSSGIGRAFALAVGLGLSEWLRGFVLTGFPWNTFSQSLADTPVLMQGFALVGPDGMTVLLVFATASLVGIIGARGRRATLYRAFPAIAIMVGLALYGSLRLTQPLEYAQGVVRIVQPNIAQAEKWKPEQRSLITKTLLDLTPVEATEAPAIVVWPEAATPYFLQDSPAVLAAIGSKLTGDQVLITGTPRHGPIQADYSAQTYNGIVVVNGLGSIVATYDKHHLVPFGEYVPLRSLAARFGLEAIVDGPSGFAEGPGPRTLVLQEGLPKVSPLVCYEVIFATEVLDPRARPDLLVNVTNDAWYGISAGPPQHLAQARLRAVEQGIPLARSANTGISALIDPYGRVVSSLPLNTSGAIEWRRPAALPPTVFGRLENAVFFTLLLVSSIIALIYRIK